MRGTYWLTRERRLSGVVRGLRVLADVVVLGVVEGAVLGDERGAAKRETYRVEGVVVVLVGVLEGGLWRVAGDKLLGADGHGRRGGYEWGCGAIEDGVVEVETALVLESTLAVDEDVATQLALVRERGLGGRGGEHGPYDRDGGHGKVG